MPKKFMAKIIAQRKLPRAEFGGGWGSGSGLVVGDTVLRDVVDSVLDGDDLWRLRRYLDVVPSLLNSSSSDMISSTSPMSPRSSHQRTTSAA
jgi:hypothetical protein